MLPFSETILDSSTSAVGNSRYRFDPKSTGLQLSGGSDWSVAVRKLRGGLSEGVLVVELCSGPLTVSVLPTRGMGIWKAEAGDVRVGWDSPVRQPVHPVFVDQSARNGLGWLDGFNELLCRCGLASNGPPGIDDSARSPIESQLTLHGRIANLPAHQVVVEVDPRGGGTLSVTGVVDECTLFGPQLRLTSRVSIDVGTQTIGIEDRIQNLASTATDLELLYHINVGPPFLEAGSRLFTPATVVVPRDTRAAEGIDEYDRYLEPTPGYAEQAYFCRLQGDARAETTALLANAAEDRGFAVSWNTRELPCFTQWKCTQPVADGYVTGLEPGTNFPNFKSFERSQGRVISLAAGAEHTARLQLDVLLTAGAVAATASRIRDLSPGAAPVLEPQPALPYCQVR